MLSSPFYFVALNRKRLLPSLRPPPMEPLSVSDFRDLHNPFACTILIQAIQRETDMLFLPHQAPKLLASPIRSQTFQPEYSHGSLRGEVQWDSVRYKIYLTMNEYELPRKELLRNIDVFPEHSPEKQCVSLLAELPNRHFSGCNRKPNPTPHFFKALAVGFMNSPCECTANRTIHLEIFPVV